MAGKAYNGTYVVKNREKYIGNPDKVTYRSSWEKTVMIRFDYNPSVLRWGSEPFPIWYLNAYDQQKHRYFVDFIVEFKGKDGNNKIVLIEVKPFKETLPPKKKGKKKARYLQECKTYITNQSKWNAAEQHCKQRGWYFTKWTEKEIYGKKI